jgi:hypothetical protein
VRTLRVRAAVGFVAGTAAEKSHTFATIRTLPRLSFP